MAGMKVDVNALKQRGATIYRDFTAGQRATLAVAALAVVVGGYLFMQWAAAPSWAPLYTNLEAQDAADVTAELDSMGVGYELRDGGTTIVVDQADVYSTRIELSAQGLPKVGGEGWNLIDDQGLTTSEFRQRVDFQRAMEGELAATIASIDAVETATVHLVIPEDDLFAGDDVHASASVLVQPAANGSLTAGQVQAIVHTVASSVEGMVPEYVTVTDTSGQVLSAPGQEDIAAGEQRVAQRSAYEQDVAESIESLLVPITGAGNARVVVSADLNFDQRESVRESFGEPDSAPVVAEDTSEETYTGTGQPVGGVLGAESTPIEAGAGGDGQYERTDASRTFAVDKVTEQIKAAPGGVRRLSVAVLVNEDAGVDTAAVTDLVNAAAGLVPDRGDTLEVTAMAFEEAGADAAAAEGTSSEEAGDDMVMTLARTGGVVLLVLLVLGLAYRSARRSSLARYPVAIPLPAADGVTNLLSDGAIAELEQAIQSERLQLEPSEPPRHVQLQEQIGDLIDRQPEDVAAVLRTWLADRRG